AGNYGVAGLIIVLIYRLVDRWAPRFLEAHQAQAKAMGELASAVKDGRDKQEHVVLALRALATEIREQRESIKELEKEIRGEWAKGATA
ncbi:MAG TPA: hypothetical protein VGM23_05375, partial [Armatimonadota bacterium]